MKATIGIALLSLGVGFAQKPTPIAGGPKSAVIVQDISFENQTSLLPPTELYTPKNDGLFRVSVYTEQMTGPTNGTFVCPSLINTDDSGVTQTRTGTGWIECASQYANPSGGIVFVVRSKANTPLSLTTVPYGLLPSGASYSVYITIERLWLKPGS
jgi:hypothetical protein